MVQGQGLWFALWFSNIMYCCQRHSPCGGRWNCGNGNAHRSKNSPTTFEIGRFDICTCTGKIRQNNQSFDVIISIAKNSIGGTGTRLVLGEGMASMQEVLSNGGKYILVHPGVLSKLKENNVDAFLVYAAAMRIETSSRFPKLTLLVQM